MELKTGWTAKYSRMYDITYDHFNILSHIQPAHGI